MIQNAQKKMTKSNRKYDIKCWCVIHNKITAIFWTRLIKNGLRIAKATGGIELWTYSSCKDGEFGNGFQNQKKHLCHAPTAFRLFHFSAWWVHRARYAHKQHSTQTGANPWGGDRGPERWQGNIRRQRRLVFDISVTSREGGESKALPSRFGGGEAGNKRCFQATHCF